jgi:hypothetical protein
MKLIDNKKVIQFLHGDILAGQYNYTDDFKPFFHPLNTPTGRTVSLASPHDHKHHKGMMYALRCEDINFWEEGGQPQAGRQHHEAFTAIIPDGDRVGFHQSLTWAGRDGSLRTFTETRSVHCQQTPEGFRWDWSTTLTALRPCRLVLSQWSSKLPDGRIINYHGLGIRFIRDFGCTGGNRLLVDGKPLKRIAEGMGMVPQAVTFEGTIDPVYPAWPPRRASVTFTQQQKNTLFVMENAFAFMALGPSNIAPVDLKEGQRITEAYAVLVRDV